MRGFARANIATDPHVRDGVLSLTRWTVWMIEPCWQNLMMSSWRGTGVEYDEYSSRMIARWEMKRIGDTRAWNYRCARIKYSSSQRCIYTMRARAIEHEQTNAVAVMGTVIKSERTRPFMPETGILKLCIRRRMNLFEHKSTRRISMRIEWCFQLAFNPYTLNCNYYNY